jgi:hypothetical protein
MSHSPYRSIPHKPYFKNTKIPKASLLRLLRAWRKGTFAALEIRKKTRCWRHTALIYLGKRHNLLGADPFNLPRMPEKLLSVLLSECSERCLHKTYKPTLHICDGKYSVRFGGLTYVSWSSNLGDFSNFNPTVETSWQVDWDD